jgi:site-specific recombinase XerD
VGQAAPSDLEMLGLYHPNGFVFPTRNGTAISIGNLRRDFKRLCRRAQFDGDDDWMTYDLRHSFASLVSDQVDDLRKVADLMGRTNTRTTEAYRHQVRAALPHAVKAWNQLLDQAGAKRRRDDLLR